MRVRYYLVMSLFLHDYIKVEIYIIIYPIRAREYQRKPLGDNSLVKMGVISPRRLVVVIGNGMQMIFPNVFS